MRKITLKGMTLIEVIISSVIVAGMMLVMLTFASSMSNTISIEQQKLAITQSGNSAIDTMVESLEASYIPDAWSLPADGNDLIQFLVPVDHDQDGDVLAFTKDAGTGEWMPEVQWGAIRDDHIPGHFIDGSHDNSDPAQSFFTAYRFVKTAEFNEATRGIDLNANGNSTEVFDVGYIQQYFSAGISQTHSIEMLERTKPLTQEIVLRLPNTDGGAWADIDNDGDPDPMFQITGTELEITLFVSRTTEADPLFEKVQTTIELRNMNLK